MTMSDLPTQPTMICHLLHAPYDAYAKPQFTISRDFTVSPNGLARRGEECRELLTLIVRLALAVT